MRSIDNQLCMACVQGNLPQVQSLLQSGADPNAQDHTGMTPFLFAAEKGDISILRTLAQHGANPYTTDKDGRNALHYAAEYDNPKAASFLITYLHLNPNSQDHQGNTPLLIALKRGHIHTAQTLSQLGANPKIPNHQGENAFDIAKQMSIDLPSPRPSRIVL